MDELLYEDFETLPDFSTKFPGDDYYNYSAFIGDNGTFYFAKNGSNDPTRPLDTYAHIEPIMRFFIYLCHVNGIFTTAGWVGINDPQSYFENLKLQEQEAIRSGLRLHNFMTGEEVFFKDKEFRVSWNNPQDVIDAGEEIRHDRIGLLVPQSNKDVISNLIENPYSTGLAAIEHKKPLDVDGTKFEHFCVSVRHEDQKTRKEEWAKLASHIMGGLGKKIKIHEDDNRRKQKHRQL